MGSLQKVERLSWKNRNGEVDFWRVVFAVIIVFLHSHGLSPNDRFRYPFVGGYLAVEFFFFLTGYFSGQKATREKACSEVAAVHPAHNAAKWTVKKFAGIYPYVIPAVLIHYIVTAVLTGQSAYQGVKSIFYGIFEMLLLPETGIYEIFLNLPLWYLSTLLVLLPPFFFIMMKARESFLYILAPICIFFIYGYFSVTVSHIDIWSKWNGVFFLSLPRAWAGLCLGAVCFLVVEKLCKTNFSVFGRHVLSVVELLSLGITLAYMFTRGYRRLDFLCIFLLAVAASILLSGAASIHTAFPAFLSKFSELPLALYVSHWTILSVIPAIMPTATYEQRLLPYIAMAVLYAIGLYGVVHCARRIALFQHLKQKMLR